MWNCKFRSTFHTVFHEGQVPLQAIQHRKNGVHDWIFCWPHRVLHMANAGKIIDNCLKFWILQDVPRGINRFEDLLHCVSHAFVFLRNDNSIYKRGFFHKHTNDFERCTNRVSHSWINEEPSGRSLFHAPLLNARKISLTFSRFFHMSSFSAASSFLLCLIIVFS